MKWWTDFADPALNHLIDIAYQQNLPLQIAGVRIMEARARLGFAVGEQYPQMQEINAAYDNVGLSKNAPNHFPFLDSRFNQAQTSFDAGWELDVWGRFRRGIESASAGMAASIAAYDDALVSLTAEVARAYVLIRTFEERLAIARSNADTERHSYQLALARFQDGAVSKLDSTQALTLLRSTEAGIPVLQAELAKSKHALSVLLGMPPGRLKSLLKGEEAIPLPPAEIAVGIPADLLRRRPDIREAEMQAASASALVGVEQSQLYPRFSLIGSVGFLTGDTGSASLGNLFDINSLAYSVGPSFSWPVLNYGRLRNKVRIQDARLQAALVNYRNSVLEAAREVKDGLTGFINGQRQVILLAQSVDAAEQAVSLANIQYRNGAVDYQRVLDTQRAMLLTQDQWVQARSNTAVSLIATYKALGGGWEMRQGHAFIPDRVEKKMEQRTNWGSLLKDDGQKKADSAGKTK